MIFTDAAEPDVMTDDITIVPHADTELRPDMLLDRLGTLRREIAEEAALLLDEWRGAMQDSRFLPSAENLAHYLVFRRADLRDIQPGLQALGLSTLGRSEAHVMPSLDAAIASLARITGSTDMHYPEAEAFTAGPATLLQNQEQVFGKDPAGPRTRIMVTLPSEAAQDARLLMSLIGEGADCVRINCAHDDEAAWAAMIRHTRQAAKALGREVRVAMDLAGPKIRIRDVDAAKDVRLFPGDRFVIAAALADKSPLPQVTLSHPQLLGQLVAGTGLWMDDGKLGARVVASTPGMATAEVTFARSKGYRLKPEKGFNLPGLELDIPALTEEDLAHLRFVAGNADIIGYSFVQTPADIRRLADELAKRLDGRPQPALMLKIETPLAVRNLPRLLVQAGSLMPVAVMIARGDLAVEIGLPRLSEIQEEILWLCESAHVPVVWATQVLETLVKEGAATRAETTDAAIGLNA